MIHIPQLLKHPKSPFCHWPMMFKYAQNIFPRFPGTDYCKSFPSSVRGVTRICYYWMLGMLLNFWSYARRPPIVLSCTKVQKLQRFHARRLLIYNRPLFNLHKTVCVGVFSVRFFFLFVFACILHFCVQKGTRLICKRMDPEYGCYSVTNLCTRYFQAGTHNVTPVRRVHLEVNTRMSVSCHPLVILLA